MILIFIISFIIGMIIFFLIEKKQTNNCLHPAPLEKKYILLSKPLKIDYEKMNIKFDKIMEKRKISFNQKIYFRFFSIINPSSNCNDYNPHFNNESAFDI